MAMVRLCDGKLKHCIKYWPARKLPTRQIGLKNKTPSTRGRRTKKKRIKFKGIAKLFLAEAQSPAKEENKWWIFPCGFNFKA